MIPLEFLLYFSTRDWTVGGGGWTGGAATGEFVTEEMVEGERMFGVVKFVAERIGCIETALAAVAVVGPVDEFKAPATSDGMEVNLETTAGRIIWGYCGE